MQLFDNNRFFQDTIKNGLVQILKTKVQAFENDCDIGSDFEKYGASMQIFGKPLVFWLTHSAY